MVWQVVENPELTHQQIEDLLQLVIESKSCVLIENIETNEFIMCGPINDENRRQANISCEALNKAEAH